MNNLSNLSIQDLEMLVEVCEKALQPDSMILIPAGPSYRYDFEVLTKRLRAELETRQFELKQAHC